MARNFVEGKGFGINPGQSMAMSSSPAWTLSLACVYFFFGNALTAGLVASVTYMIAAGVLICRLTLKMGGKAWAGALAAIIILMDPIALWGYASGMEIPLVVFSVVPFFYCYYVFPPDSRTRAVGVPLAATLAAATRPELFVLMPIAAADTWFANASNISKRMAWKILAVQAAVLAAALAPYFAFNLATTSHLFPSTYYAKTEVRNVGFAQALKIHDFERARNLLTKESVNELVLISRVFLRHNFLVFMLAPIGLLAFLKRFSGDGRSKGWLLPAVLVLLPLAMGVMVPSESLSNYAGRYFTPLLPMIAIATALGLSLLTTWLQRGPSRLVGTFGGCVLIGLLYLGEFQPTIERFGKDAATTERLYVDMGKWIAENIVLDEGECMAVNDIGGFSYYSHKCALDIMGLASPEMWPLLEGKSGKQRGIAIYRYLQERGMHYLVISPRYYPELTRDDSLVRPLKKFTAPYRARRHISPQIIYEIPDGVNTPRERDRG
jgi:hypothetical protein